MNPSIIYIVCKPNSQLLGSTGVPVAAYSDFPSAFAYANTLSLPNLPPPIGLQAKDLIFMLTLVPTPVAPPVPATS